MPVPGCTCFAQTATTAPMAARMLAHQSKIVLEPLQNTTMDLAAGLMTTAPAYSPSEVSTAARDHPAGSLISFASQPIEDMMLCSSWNIHCMDGPSLANRAVASVNMAGSGRRSANRVGNLADAGGGFWLVTLHDSVEGATLRTWLTSTLTASQVLSSLDPASLIRLRPGHTASCTGCEGGVGVPGPGRCRAV